jgi:membrane-bound ClpP family serine protease
MIELMVYGYVGILVLWLLEFYHRFTFGRLKKLALFLFGVIIMSIELFYGREGA